MTAARSLLTASVCLLALGAALTHASCAVTLSRRPSAWPVPTAAASGSGNIMAALRRRIAIFFPLGPNTAAPRVVAGSTDPAAAAAIVDGAGFNARFSEISAMDYSVMLSRWLLIDASSLRSMTNDATYNVTTLATDARITGSSTMSVSGNSVFIVASSGTCVLRYHVVTKTFIVYYGSCGVTTSTAPTGVATRLPLTPAPLLGAMVALSNESLSIFAGPVLVHVSTNTVVATCDVPRGAASMFATKAGELLIMDPDCQTFFVAVPQATNQEAQAIAYTNPDACNGQTAARLSLPASIDMTLVIDAAQKVATFQLSDCDSPSGTATSEGPSSSVTTTTTGAPPISTSTVPPTTASSTTNTTGAPPISTPTVPPTTASTSSSTTTTVAPPTPSTPAAATSAAASSSAATPTTPPPTTPAPAAPTPPTPTTPTMTTPTTTTAALRTAVSTPASDGKEVTNVLIGVVVAVFVIAVLLVTTAFCLCRGKKRRDAERETVDHVEMSPAGPVTSSSANKWSGGDAAHTEPREVARVAPELMDKVDSRSASRSQLITMHLSSPATAHQTADFSALAAGDAPASPNQPPGRPPADSRMREGERSKTLEVSGGFTAGGISDRQLSAFIAAERGSRGDAEASTATVRRFKKRCEAVAAGAYQKGRILGRGANGTVYAVLLKDGSTIAMKEVNLMGSEDEIRAQMNEMDSEVRLLRDLHHPNLVTYYGVQADNKSMQMRLFMENVTGGSLGAMVRSMGEQLDEDTARVFAQQIVKGLAFIHSRGIVHRDLKCDNILRDSHTGLVKLADFGTAKSLGNAAGASKAAQTMIGTPYFMAPEILLSGMGELENGGYGIKADVWSLGITVAELLNRGVPPWPAFPSPGHAFLHISSPQGIPTMPDGLSVECQDFIRRCTDRNPATRPTANELLMHDWLACVEDSFSATFTYDNSVEDFAALRDAEAAHVVSDVRSAPLQQSP